MTHATTARVTSSGQISVPAEIRRRWGATAVVIVDAGDRLIVRPVPDDPVRALRGKYASVAPSSGQMRAESRRDDDESQATRR